MRWVRQLRPHADESRLYRTALFITLGGNLILVIGKAIAASLSGSAALYADAANSASDVAYSLLMVLGLTLAIQPPDLSHPQGHYRFEPFVGLLITLSMTFAGYEAARTAIERFIAGGAAIQPGLPTLVLLTAAAIKGGMFLLIRRLAERLHSPTLRTTAADNLSDVLTSLAAFLGILGSQLHPLLDPVAGVLVSLWIFRAAFLAGRENIGFLTGAGASEEVRLKLVQTAQSIAGVQRVHHLMTDYVGPRLIVDMHINVDAEMSLRAAHTICDQVIEALEALPEVDRAYVHLEPEDWTD